MSDSSFDISAMMKQAQQLTGRMKQMQEELRHRSAEATVGGGMVTAVVNGALEVVEVRIDPRAVDPRDVEMLQDLVAVAVNQALKRAQQLVQEEMQKVTGVSLDTLLGSSNR